MRFHHGMRLPSLLNIAQALTKARRISHTYSLRSHTARRSIDEDVFFVFRFFCFLSFFTLAHWNAIVCVSCTLSGENSTFPIFQRIHIPEFLTTIAKKIARRVWGRKLYASFVYDSDGDTRLLPWSAKESKYARLPLYPCANYIFSKLDHLEFEGRLARKLHFQSLNTWNLKEISHERFIFKARTLGISLAQKISFQSLTIWNLKEVSHKSFTFKAWTLGIWRKSRTEASFSKLEHLEFEGNLARNAFLRGSGCTKCCVLQDKTCFGWCVGGSLSGGRFRNMLGSTGIMAGSVAQWNCEFRRHFHNFNCQNLTEISHESFIFKAWTFRISRKSGTKASFSKLERLAFQGSLAQKLHFQSLNIWNLKEISHESFIFKARTLGIWRTSRTKAFFSTLEHLEFEGSLARKLHFQSLP